MSTLQSIQVMITANNLMTEHNRNPQVEKFREVQINYQAEDGWVVTGKYQNNVLQTISLHKRPVKAVRK